MIQIICQGKVKGIVKLIVDGGIKMKIMVDGRLWLDGRFWWMEDYGGWKVMVDMMMGLRL